MKKKIYVFAGVLAASLLALAACSSQNDNNVETNPAPLAQESTTTEQQTPEIVSEVDVKAEVHTLEDGIYTVDFDTDSSMFHANEACDGKGTLTVTDGKMNLHVSLVSKSIVNLYLGTADDAQKDGAVLLEPTIDNVTYSDGITEEVYGFDIPLACLDEEFDLAIIGTKGVWYDHKVKASNPELKSEGTADDSDEILVPGEYKATLTMTGGTGKAYIESPVEIVVENDSVTAVLIWSSKNYDYMLVDGKKYLNEANEGEPSVFTVPIVLNEEMTVIGDTVAMSTPHEVEYTLLFELTE